MNAVRNWYKTFLPLVVPYLYKNGGPIITVQVILHDHILFSYITFTLSFAF